MHYFEIRNWEVYQHYSKRNPPWIRLYYKILQDRRFFRLDNSTKWLAVGCFLLASQHQNRIPFDEEWIIKELSFEGTPNWQALLESEFIKPIDCDASTMLAECKRGASHIQITQNADNSECRSTEILSISPKAAKPSFGEASEIFRFWNNQAATMHHRAINGQEKSVVQALRHYAPEEIRRAIERYSIVRANKEGKYRELYQWTLGEFLSRNNHYNIERFNAQEWEAPFLAGAFAGGKKPGEGRQRDVLDIMLEQAEAEENGKRGSN